MAGLPDSLAIALWLVCALWGVAVVAYLSGAPTDFILPLIALGILTAVAEWLARRRLK